MFFIFFICWFMFFSFSTVAAMGHYRSWSLHKKWSFFSKDLVTCGFVHIYWKIFLTENFNSFTSHSNNTASNGNGNNKNNNKVNNNNSYINSNDCRKFFWSPRRLKDVFKTCLLIGKFKGGFSVTVSFLPRHAISHLQLLSWRRLENI